MSHPNLVKSTDLIHESVIAWTTVPHTQEFPILTLGLYRSFTKTIQVKPGSNVSCGIKSPAFIRPNSKNRYRPFPLYDVKNLSYAMSCFLRQWNSLESYSRKVIPSDLSI